MHICILIKFIPSSLTSSSSLPPFSLPLYLFRATGVCMGVGLSTGARTATWGLHPFPLPAAISSQKLLSWGGTPFAPPRSVPGILTGFVQVLSGAMSSCMQHCHVQQILLCYRHPFPLALQSILDFFQEEP